MDFAAVVATVVAAVDERNARRAALGARIREIAERTLDVCALDKIEPAHGGNPPWTLRHGQVVATCSQWGDGSDSRTGREDTLLVSVPGARDRVIGEVPDCSFHDGHNMQRQQGPAYLAGTEHAARPAPVALLRRIAAELPAVIAAALAAREASVREQATDASAALASL